MGQKQTNFFSVLTLASQQQFENSQGESRSMRSACAGGVAAAFNV